MVIFSSCQAAAQFCSEHKTFAIARIYRDENTMNIHVHDCYEIYYSIAGGKQFLIDGHLYEIEPGDIFFINQFECHGISEADEKTHERIVLFVHPECLEKMSTPMTDLSFCFTRHKDTLGHKLSLSEYEQTLFMYFIHKLSSDGSFGQDVVDRGCFSVVMVILNRFFMSRLTEALNPCTNENALTAPPYSNRIDEILSYINQHLDEDLNVPMLASHFYISSSHLYKLFKDATGTTVTQYIIEKRIAYAKVLLEGGHSVSETSTLCGFKDYSNFLRSFTKIVGVSPKKFAVYSSD